MVGTLAQAMQAAHEAGIIHRDLKPANVLLTTVSGQGTGSREQGTGSREQGTGSREQGKETSSVRCSLFPVPGSQVPKITDFGLAKKLDEASQTLSGAVVGTPSYMAPEQAGGHTKNLGPAADIYALGAILYECLTGRPPFKAATPYDTVAQVLHDDPVSPRRLQPKTPRDIETICQKCLQKEPSRRYPSAAALADDLQRFLNREPILARPTGHLARAVRWGRRNKALTAFAAAVLMLFVGAVAAGFWYQAEKGKRDSQAALRRQSIQTAQEQTSKRRNELLELLLRPGGVFALLNKPANWQAHIDSPRSSLDQAKALLSESEDLADSNLRDEVRKLDSLLGQDDADRKLAMDFDRLHSSVVFGGDPDYRTAIQNFAKAFAEAKLLVEQDDLETLAARIVGSPIKEQLVAALDDWAYLIFVDGQQSELLDRLLGLARSASPDPLWGDKLRQRDTWKNRRELCSLAEKAEPKTMPRQLLSLMGALLGNGTTEQEAWLRKAQAFHPDDFWLNMQLGNAIWLGIRPGNAKNDYRLAQAEGFYRASLAVRRDNAWAYNNLGNTLSEQKRSAEAMDAFKKAIELNPQFYPPYNGLGNVLFDQNCLADAAAAYQKTIELSPKKSLPYNGLGNVRLYQKRIPEAIDAYQKAIEADPEYAFAFNNLGNALREQNSLGEAIVAYQKAIKIDPRYAMPYNGLGNAFFDQKRLDEAIGAYRKAIELNKNLPPPYNGLGNALLDQNHVADATAAFRKAIALNPKYPSPYNGLGNALREQKLWGEAITAYRKAIDLQPENVMAHNNLGIALLEQGAFNEAAESAQALLRLLPANHSFHEAAENRLKTARLQILEKRLPAVLAGTDKAKAGDLLALAQMCQEKKRYPTAVHLFQEAFEAQSELAHSGAENKQHRYDAACAAALAGCGQGGEAGKLADKEKAKLRRQSRDWLQADLDLYVKKAKEHDIRSVFQVVLYLQHWQQDGDLARVRDPEELAKLPDDERKNWQKLWDDVRQTLKDAQGPSQ